MNQTKYARLIASAILATAASALAAPANDNFADAIALTGDSGVQTGPSTVDATYEVGEPDLHGYVGPTVWFKWTCTHTGTLTVSTVGSLNASGEDWDAAVDVYDGGPALGGLNSIQFVDTGFQETFDQAVSAGTTYYIRMGWGGGGSAPDATTLLVTWSFALPPALTANAGPGQGVSAAAPSVTIGGSPTARFGSAPYTYSWSPSSNLDDATLANPTASPTTTTTYTVTVTDAIGATATSSEVVKYVLPNPNLISVDFVYSDSGSLPFSGDTSTSGTLNKNAVGEIYTGQTGAWNAMNVGGNNANTGSASVSALHNGAGGVTTVAFKMGAAAASGAAAGNWRNNYVVAFGNLRQEQAYVYSPTLTASHYAWELTGLVPNAHYRLTLFGDGGSSYTNIANSVAGVLDAEGDWNWSDITADAAGVILGDFATSGHDQVNGLYGLQIETAAAALTAYQTWANAHAGGGTPSEDSNHDGVSNGIAYFMGATGLATNPGVVNGKVNWPCANLAIPFAVEVSSDLSTWTAANPADIDTTSTPGHVIYTLPTGAAKKFCRLVVTP